MTNLNYLFALSACLKIVLEDGKDKGTIRTCWAKALTDLVGLESDKCVPANSSQLYSLIGVTVPSSFETTVCTCTGDNCNSSSTLKITQGSLMVLVIGFLTSKFMY